MADAFTPPSFYDIIKGFTDVEKLTKWATNNLLLQHQYVIDRLATLLTCMECNLKCSSQNDLVQHLELHAWIDEIACIDGYRSESTQNDSSNISSWCNIKFGSVDQLKEHEVVQELNGIDHKINPKEINRNIEIIYTRSPSQGDVMFDKTRTTSETPFDAIDRPHVQYGAGGVNNPNYIFRITGEKTFAKNLARETTYKVKFTDKWEGSKLKDLGKDLHDMFDDVLAKAKGSDNDLGHVVLSQSEFHNPIVVPLQKWENIDTNKVMEAVERVLNSDENIKLDKS